MENYMNSYLNMCEEKKADASTVKAYRLDLKEYSTFIKEQQLNFTDHALADTWFTYLLNRNITSSTKRRKLASVRLFYDYLINQRVIQQNPYTGKKYRIKVESLSPDYLKMEEITKLYKTLYTKQEHFSPYDEFISLRDRAVMELFLHTGIRISELRELYINHINFKEKKIEILGNNKRILPIEVDTLSFALMEYYYCDYRKNIVKSEYFFISKLGTRISEQSIRRIFTKYKMAAGIQCELTPKLLRNSIAVLSLKNNMDYKTFCYYMGISAVDTFKRYEDVLHNELGKMFQYHFENKEDLHYMESNNSFVLNIYEHLYKAKVQHFSDYKYADHRHWITGELQTKIIKGQRKAFLHFFVTVANQYIPFHQLQKYMDNQEEIFEKAVEVDADTLSRCTGKEDISGELVFENDIIESHDGTVVLWPEMIIHYGTYQAYCPHDQCYVPCVGFYATGEELPDMPIGDLPEYAKVIGNIHYPNNRRADKS